MTVSGSTLTPASKQVSDSTPEHANEQGKDQDKHRKVRKQREDRPVFSLLSRHALLSRKEAATALNISHSEFRRREAITMYVPTLVDERGWHLFSREYLSTLPGYGANEKQEGPGRESAAKKEALFKQAELKKESQRVDGYEPETAAQVFQALDDGMSSREIVKKLLIHPNTMDAVYKAWLHLATQDGGGIVVSAKQMAIINELPLPGSFPILTGDQLVINMTKASRGTSMCPVCNARPCQICVVCAQPEPEPPAPTPAKKGPGRPKAT